jgi:ribose transport system substrate-binding protein
MRIRTAAAIALCACLSALSCKKASSGEERIEFIPKGRAHEFWQSVHAGAIKAMRENPGYTVIWNGPASETDFEGQVQIADAAINQHVDAICLAPIDRKILVTLVERAPGRRVSPSSFSTRRSIPRRSRLR